MEKTTIDLTTTQGFCQAYFENLKKVENQQQAYEETELQYMCNHNTEIRKYASFQSFRQIKNRHLKNNR